MQKQQLASFLYGIAGTPMEVEPLFTSLYNWNAIFKNAPCGELLDLGSPESFQYFLCMDNDYILGRTRAFCNQLAENPKYKGKHGGVIELAKEMAIKEWQLIPNERFLNENDEVVINPYKLGILDDVELQPQDLKPVIQNESV
jgi:hypothetical protein